MNEYFRGRDLATLSHLRRKKICNADSFKRLYGLESVAERILLRFERVITPFTTVSVPSERDRVETTYTPPFIFALMPASKVLYGPDVARLSSTLQAFQKF